MDLETAVQKLRNRPKFEDATLTITDAKAVQSVFQDSDDLFRFRVQAGFESYKAGSSALERWASFYEKLIVLNGATIALSLTFLASLSTRLSNAHVPQRPALWMVELSWFFLLLSICCSSLQIAAFHNLNMSVYAGTASALPTYVNERLRILTLRMSRLVSGEVPVEGEKVEISNLLSEVSAALHEEGNDVQKQLMSLEQAISTASRQQRFASVAVLSTLVAMGLLCIFTLRTLSLLF